MKTEKKPGGKNPPVMVIKRLPRYFRYLRELVNSRIKRISSAELSKIMKVNASQIRQDLNYFGGFGQQGYGYNVSNLYREISSVLGVDEGYRAVIIGAGKLGSALAGSPVFSKRGVSVVGLFDSNKSVVGKEIVGHTVRDISNLKEFCIEERVDIAVLTLPSDRVPEIIKLIPGSGIRGVWNFTSVDLKNEDVDVTVENVHMGDSLMTLCYNLKKNSEQ